MKRVTQVSDLTGFTVYTVTSLVENTKIRKGEKGRSQNVDANAKLMKKTIKFDTNRFR